MPGPYFSRAPKVMVADIGEGLVALDAAKGSSFIFDEVAKSLWEALEQPRSFAQLRDRLMSEYDAPGDQCAADLTALLDELVAIGLVEKGSAAGNRRGSARKRPAPAPIASEPAQEMNRDHGHSAPLSPEMSLAVECCRWAFAGGPMDAQPGASHIDWARFLRLIRFHRVQGLVYECAAKAGITLPSEVRQAVAADAIAIAAANLRTAAEARDLLALFAAANVPAIVVKGLPLGALAYGNAALKASVDIDLLVAADQLDHAAAVLRQSGYALDSPKGSPGSAQLRTWHRLRKESTWLRRGLQVDLHSRLADNTRMIPSIGLDSPRQYVGIFGDVTLPTLADAELFAYLAVHGASSAWFRLKWITDFAAFVHRLGPESIEPLYRRSQELGAGRAANQALLLADRFYGTLARSPGLAKELRRNRASNRLYRIALTELAGRAEPVEPTEQFLGTAAIHYSQMMLRPGAGFALTELVRQVRAAFG